MRTIIFCEGTTDILLLQFVLQYKYSWKYEGFIENSVTNRLKKKTLIKGADLVELRSCNGIMNIPKELLKVKDILEYSTRVTEIYDRIIVMIDHDTVSSNGEFIGQLNDTLHTDFSESQMNNYFDWDIANDVLGKLSIKVLIKCIPESDIGAIETVMLKALETDDIERNLISDSSKFINIIAGKQQRYLQKKSRISKAIFNTYFAIRTPEEKYDERAKILNAYNWKENSVLDDSFDFLNLLN